MKVSRAWLQTFFETPLPEAVGLAEALTFHAFEIENVANDVLNVKVTPNRGHDCLSHRGIAKEVSAILKLPMKSDPLREDITLEPATDAVSVAIEDSKLCARYIACYVRGVKVGPSPEWLSKSLEAIGQKSINNIVDATNFVMFNIGQPLHAFDARKLGTRDKGKGKYQITVRSAKKGGKTLALDDKEYVLSTNDLVIVDGNSDSVIGIAGVKGGKAAGTNEKTMDIILESANFDGVSIRRTAQALKLRTDASERFQQVISPELAAYGMRAAADLIVKVAGGEIIGFADAYPRPQEKREVSVSLDNINGVLGTKLTVSDVTDVFARLGLPYECDEASPHRMCRIGVPFERLDLTIPEDLVEEVARIVGYEKIPPAELPPFPKKPEVNQNFYAAEKKREELIAKGYSEVFTSVFADKGERAVLNKVGGEKPYLRTTLVVGLREALERNTRNKDLLGLKEVKLFEIGSVWRDGEEVVAVGTVSEKRKASERLLADYIKGHEEEYVQLPLSTTERYQPFSRYPSIVRDIALWVPKGTSADKVLTEIRSHAGDLLVRSWKFDEFSKGDKVSYAFRLVFQSYDRTLFDNDANERMESIYEAVKKKGWEVR